MVGICFFFQAEDGIRDLVRSRGLGDVYKRQDQPQPRLHAEVVGQALVEVVREDEAEAGLAPYHLSLIHI